MPTSRAVESGDGLEEERRLMYVAITRAKERLYLSRSKSRYLYGKREPTARSRFLKELADHVDLPKEQRRSPYGYSDDGDYGSAYGARSGGYGYGSSAYADRQNSAVKRSSYSGSSYGAAYGAKPVGAYTGGASTSSQASYGGAVKPKVGATKDLSAFGLGKKVSHPKFGEGTIVGLKGEGKNMILDVAFVGLGIKQLSAMLAPLTVLG